MTKNTEENTERRLDNLKPAWKPGQSGNLNGRPVGQRNYGTIYREALMQLAQRNGTTAEQLENDILINEIRNARAGNYPFVKDLLDRLFGKATQPLHHTGGIESTLDQADEEGMQMLDRIREKYEKEFERTIREKHRPTETKREMPVMLGTERDNNLLGCETLPVTQIVVRL